MTMKLLYFAWVRERIGKPEEEIEPPAGDRDCRRADGVARQPGRAIRLRVREPQGDTRRHRPQPVRPEARIEGAGEIAFFPPMTGG